MNVVVLKCEKLLIDVVRQELDVWSRDDDLFLLLITSNLIRTAAAYWFAVSCCSRLPWLQPIGTRISLPIIKSPDVFSNPFSSSLIRTWLRAALGKVLALRQVYSFWLQFRGRVGRVTGRRTLGLWAQIRVVPGSEGRLIVHLISSSCYLRGLVGPGCRVDNISYFVSLMF